MDKHESLVLSAERPHTGTVLLWFSAAASVVSYLAAYAFVNALVAAEVLAHWPVGRDPRPRLLLTIFCSLTGAGFVAAGMTRCLSRRHLRSLLEMEQTPEEGEGLLKIMRPIGKSEARNSKSETNSKFE